MHFFLSNPTKPPQPPTTAPGCPGTPGLWCDQHPLVDNALGLEATPLRSAPFRWDRNTAAARSAPHVEDVCAKHHRSTKSDVFAMFLKGKIGRKERVRFTVTSLNGAKFISSQHLSFHPPSLHCQATSNASERRRLSPALKISPLCGKIPWHLRDSKLFVVKSQRFVFLLSLVFST